MTPIEVHILLGNSAGRAATFDEPQLVFGRSPDNAIVIESQHVSRQHGALVYQDDGWYVVNNSPNGTTVNGKAIGKKPQKLKSGDVIGVARTKMMEVRIVEGEAGPAAGADEADDQPTQAAAGSGSAQAAPPKARNKLWIALGIYVLAMLVIVVVASSLINDEEVGPTRTFTRMSTTQIADAMRHMPDVQVSMTEAEKQLREAVDARSRIGQVPGARYQAYDHYKQARAHARGQEFAELNEAVGQFETLGDALIERVTDQYNDMYNLYKNGNLRAAEAAARQLQQMLAMDADNPVFKSAGDLIGAIRSRQPIE